jgi:tRNA threonylcarbamoyladenosine biosynthesis protein TsaE
MEETFKTANEEETIALAARFAKRLTPGSVIALQGELGAGKTRFAKGIARGLGIDEHLIDSPTFTLLQEYRTRDGSELFHFDFYRIESVEEALEIGVEEYFYGEGISLVEWPDRVTELLPDDTIHVFIEVSGRKERTISLLLPEKKVTD